MLALGGLGSSVASVQVVVQSGLSVWLWLCVSLGLVEGCGLLIMLKLGAGIGWWVLGSL